METFFFLAREEIFDYSYKCCIGEENHHRAVEINLLFKFNSFSNIEYFIYLIGWDACMFEALSNCCVLSTVPNKVQQLGLIEDSVLLF